MGQPRFELGSMAPKATRIDLATLLPRCYHVYLRIYLLIQSYINTLYGIATVARSFTFFRLIKRLSLRAM